MEQQAHSAIELQAKKCLPCEGGIDPCPIDFSKRQLAALQDWQISDDGKFIERKFKRKNFVECIQLLNRIGELAEVEQHHPDLHLTGYRHLKVVLTTHAIGGLSENDFIVAAKIDALCETEG